MAQSTKWIVLEEVFVLVSRNYRVEGSQAVNLEVNGSHCAAASSSFVSLCAVKVQSVLSKSAFQ